MKIRTQSKSGYNLVYLVVILVILCIVLFFMIKPGNQIQQPAEITTEKIMLFNGENLDGWEFFVVDSTISAEQVFSVKEGVIHITGEPFGYMRTKKVYSDYELHVEWRWVDEPGNSGVFLNISGEDKEWPTTIECQLMAGNAGDLVFLGESDAFEKKDKSKIVVSKYGETAEKETGGWNVYDIHYLNDSIVVYVNSVLQNVCSQPIPEKGFVGLQSEGAPIEFRNVYLIK